ncbi:MAG: ABC transporter ATP-binding protein [Endomicrobia bacterium]|nr:ABC transporter ATP-binding protein [Endomicrobiia bacterium]
MNNLQPIVKINNVWKIYYKNISITVLKNISFFIYPAEFIAIMGPSGSGKTTLLGLIGCLDKPTKGEIFIDNANTNTLSDSELALLRNKKIGFVFQNFNLIPYLNVYQNVELPLWYAKKENFEVKNCVIDTIKKVGLEHRITHKPAELSGGEQQRVAIARALVNHPEIILADEPTGNLDTKTGSAIIELFQKLNREEKITVVLVTHNLEIAKQAHRVILLQDGEIVSDKYNP